jgi:hypothetical protein
VELSEPPKSIAVLFLARGADPAWKSSVARFVESYRRFPAGIEHRLYVIFKGFAGEGDRADAQALFAGFDISPIDLADDGFDIGAYLNAARQVREEFVCFLNTNSEIVGAEWLSRLATNLAKPEVGMVGATGSLESNARFNPLFPPFPNVHLRSNAFMLNREILLEIGKELVIRDRWDALLFESGPQSLSRQIRARGLQLLVVGRNGEGYPPESWSSSDTFRQSAQENLLVADNRTRDYQGLTEKARQAMAQVTWGEYLLANIPTRP